MAIFHFSAQVISRANGDNAVAAAAYRAGLRAYFGECDRSFRRIVTGGLSGDFSSVSVT